MQVLGEAEVPGNGGIAKFGCDAILLVRYTMSTGGVICIWSGRKASAQRLSSGQNIVPNPGPMWQMRSDVAREVSR
ncbi:hypothetical protein AAE478_007027 [Parahypoxylon ruwenzoriense]